jgi:hypothetical protein
MCSAIFPGFAKFVLCLVSVWREEWEDRNEKLEGSYFTSIAARVPTLKKYAWHKHGSHYFKSSKSQFMENVFTLLQEDTRLPNALMTCEIPPLQLFQHPLSVC